LIQGAPSGSVAAIVYSASIPGAEMADQNTAGDKPKPLNPRTKPTGQKRSLERGKSTRKKNPGKRPHKGG
jgi:hypothetical protein